MHTAPRDSTPAAQPLGASFNRTKTQRYTAYAIATLLIVTSSLGLLYNFSSLYAALTGGFDRSPGIAALPGFFTAFFVMSGICVACYFALIAASIGLCRGSAKCARLIAFLLLFEVVYFFAVAALWTIPSVGKAIAAATGIANGGLMVQFILLIPLWVPIAFAFFGLYRDGGVPIASNAHQSLDTASGG